MTWHDGLLCCNPTTLAVMVRHSRVLGMLEEKFCVLGISRVDARRQGAVNLQHTKEVHISTAEVP